MKKITLILLLLINTSTFSYFDDDYKKDFQKPNNIINLFKEQKIDSIKVFKKSNNIIIEKTIRPNDFDKLLDDDGIITEENYLFLKPKYKKKCSKRITSSLSKIYLYKPVSQTEIMWPAEVIYKFSFYKNGNEIVNFYVSRDLKNGFFEPKINQYTEDVKQGNTVEYINRYYFELSNFEQFYDIIKNNCNNYE